MVINHLEKLFVTSDASTIINELEVEHPAAKLLVLAAQAQQQEIGDGTNFVSSHTAELWTIKPFQLFSTFNLSLFIRVLCKFYFFSAHPSLQYRSMGMLLAVQQITNRSLMLCWTRWYLLLETCSALQKGC